MKTDDSWKKETQEDKPSGHLASGGKLQTAQLSWCLSRA